MFLIAIAVRFSAATVLIDHLPHAHTFSFSISACRDAYHPPM
jgi:hypothetical protein